MVFLTWTWKTYYWSSYWINGRRRCCFKTNAGIENKKQVQQLYKEFDRVILACGSKKARDIKAPGRDAKGIYFAVDYLTGITKSLLNSQLEDQTFVETKGKNVLVIGGGDTGNDCVGSAFV